MIVTGASCVFPPIVTRTSELTDLGAARASSVLPIRLSLSVTVPVLPPAIEKLAVPIVTRFSAPPPGRMYFTTATVPEHVPEPAHASSSRVVRELVVATFAVVVASSTAGGAAGITGAGGAGRGVAGLGGAGATTRKATVRRRPWPG